MKAWPKGKDGGYGQEGNTGGGRVIFDLECPSGSNGLGDNNDSFVLPTSSSILHTAGLI